MNGQRVAAVAILVASLFVLGTMAGSLEATVSSTPDDVIDVDTDSLPFAGDGASEIADSYRQSEDGERASGGTRAETGPESDGAGNGEGDVEGPSPGAGSSQVPGSGGEGDRSGGGGGEGQQRGGGGQDDGASSGAGSDSGQQGTGTGLGESLWSLLAQYLALLLAALAVLALLVLARSLARRRDRLRTRLLAVAERFGLLGSGDDPDPAVADGEGAASTVVERAWGEMVGASAANPPPSDTPRECARRVIAAGADPEPVEELTAMYEQVRYGRGSVTATDASRALERARESTPGDGVAVDGGVERTHEAEAGR